MMKSAFFKTGTLLLTMTAAAMFCGCPADRENTRAFVVGLEPGFPPMEFTDEKGVIVGYDVDMATEVARRLGYVIKIKEIAWDNKEDELRTGTIDCIWSSLSINEERQKTMLFTPPYLENSQVFIVKTADGYADKDALRGKKIGMQAGSTSQDAIETDPNLSDEPTQHIKYHDIPTAFLDLKNGAIDAILIDVVVANYMAKNSGNVLRVLDYPLAEELYGVGFRPESRELRDKVWKALTAMEADGTVAKISQKWFGTNLSIIGRR